MKPSCWLVSSAMVFAMASMTSSASSLSILSRPAIAASGLRGKAAADNQSLRLHRPQAPVSPTAASYSFLIRMLCPNKPETDQPSLDGRFRGFRSHAQRPTSVPKISSRQSMISTSSSAISTTRQRLWPRTTMRPSTLIRARRRPAWLARTTPLDREGWQVCINTRSVRHWLHVVSRGGGWLEHSGARSTNAAGGIGSKPTRSGGASRS